jgi:hypothetical protein
MDDFAHTDEPDDAFLDRQFRQSIDALERVHALSPGEFEYLANTSLRSDEERTQRSLHHVDIARRALIACQQGILSEEDFNIWSGRRKENGQPVKFRFERAYANVVTPPVSRLRGTLTGIVRAFQRLLDQAIDELADDIIAAESAEELIEVQFRAVEQGFLEFQAYRGEYVNGWPSFLRSTGRFRGAVRLRELIEEAQRRIPIPAHLAHRLVAELRARSWYEDPAKSPNMSTAENPFARFIAGVHNLFRRKGAPEEPPASGD